MVRLIGGKIKRQFRSPKVRPLDARVYAATPRPWFADCRFAPPSLACGSGGVHIDPKVSDLTSFFVSVKSRRRAECRIALGGIRQGCLHRLNHLKATATKLSGLKLNQLMSLRPTPPSLNQFQVKPQVQEPHHVTKVSKARISPIYRREPAKVYRGAMLSQASLNGEPVPRQFDGTDPTAESII